MNAFDQFDTSGNPFDQFDAAKPTKIGSEGFGDFLRAELQNADWGTRNIAGFGTALSNVWEGAKQFVGKGDRQQIEANRIIEQEAPVGAIAGNVAMTAIPFAAAGNSINTAAKLGTVMGALHPVEGEQTARNIVEGKLKSTAMGGATAALGQGIANKAGEYVTQKLSELALRKAQNAPLEKTLNDALDAGLVVTPSAVNPSVKNTVLESIGGKTATAQQVSNRNAETIDNLARKAVGLDESAPLTSKAMQDIRKQAYKAGYEPVKGQMTTDEVFAQTLDDLVAKHRGASGAFPGAFDDVVEKTVAAFKVPGFEASAALKATQRLRDEANVAFRKGDTDIAQAKKGVAKAIEDQIERGLAGGGQLLENFRNARVLMAKAHTVEDAIVEGGGTINARKLAARAQAGKPLTDELAVIGNFANNFKSSTQPAQQIQGPAVSKLNSAASLFAGGSGAILGGPVAAVAGMAAPFVIPPLARKALLSKRSQNALRDMYRLGMAPRAANRLLQHAPVGGTVLGLEALSQ